MCRPLVSRGSPPSGWMVFGIGEFPLGRVGLGASCRVAAIAFPAGVGEVALVSLTGLAWLSGDQPFTLQPLEALQRGPAGLFSEDGQADHAYARVLRDGNEGNEVGLSGSKNTWTRG